MGQYLHVITGYAANSIEILATIIIVYAAGRAFISYLYSNLKKHIEYSGEVRLELGRSLSLALEFLLGADILKTAVAPKRNALGMLAAIAALRTALNYFPEREFKNRAKNRQYVISLLCVTLNLFYSPATIELIHG